MELTKSILEDIREAAGLTRDSTDFDTDLIMHINVALGTLNQNGIGNIIVLTDTSTTWGDFQDPLAIEGNKLYHLVPAFVKLSVKMIFDPPPPSAVEYYSKSIAEILWRLKIVYELPYDKKEVIINEYND